MEWKKPAYWTIAFLLLALIVLSLGAADQTLNVLPTASTNTTGVTP